MSEQAWGPTWARGDTDDPPGAGEWAISFTSWGVSLDWSPRPSTPLTSAASDDGTRGSVVARRAVRPEARRARTNGTANAASTWAVVPVTGMSRSSPDVAPTVRPVLASQRRVASMVAEVGPNTEANCPGARYRWYLGSPGVDTASTKSARAEGSRGRSATSTVNGVPVSAGPSTVEPDGTVTTVPASRTMGSGAADAPTAGARAAAASSTAAPTRA